MRLVITLFALLTAGCTARGTCDAPPAATTFTLGPPQAGESQAEAEARAARCVHYQAYRLAASRDDANAVADAVVGACIGQLQHAQAAAYLAATAADAAFAPPPGFSIDVPARAEAQAPPCPNGAATCKPWERQWPAGAGPKVGAVVTDDGRVSEPGDDEPSAAHSVGETLAARVAAEMRSLAIFRVVEARAGKCRVN